MIYDIYETYNDHPLELLQTVVVGGGLISEIPIFITHFN